MLRTQDKRSRQVAFLGFKFSWLQQTFADVMACCHSGVADSLAALGPGAKGVLTGVEGIILGAASLSAEDELIQSIDKEARQEAEDAANFADQSPFPPEESILEDIYWEEDNRSEKTTSQGTIIFE